MKRNMDLIREALAVELLNDISCDIPCFLVEVAGQSGSISCADAHRSLARHFTLGQS